MIRKLAITQNEALNKILIQHEEDPTDAAALIAHAMYENPRFAGIVVLAAAAWVHEDTKSEAARTAVKTFAAIGDRILNKTEK